jgi:uncharacterized membrane protein
MSLLQTVLLCLHLLAGTLWVGGMAALQFAVRPAAAEALPPPARLTFMSVLLARFFRWVIAAIVVLMATGLAMVAQAGGFGAVGWHVHAMFGIALLMTVLFVYIRAWPFPALQRHVGATDWPAAAAALARIRSVILANLLLGVLVYVVALLGQAQH